jgi:apolipoprotein N-acyltransferase
MTLIDITPASPSTRLRSATALIMLGCLLGIAHGASFAPVVSWPGELLTLTVLVGLLDRARTLPAAVATAFAFGLGWFGAGIHWIYISLHDYGEMHMALAAGAVLALCVIMAIYPALAAALWFWLRGRHARAWHAPMFALCWGGSEWLRATLFTGFPWIATGYAHVEGPLAGFAPVGGVHLVSTAAAAVAAGLAHALADVDWQGPRRAGWRRWPLAALLLVAGTLLGWKNWTTPHGQPISVRLAQGNVPQDVKFATSHLAAQFRLYDSLARESRADLIALPETAYPVPLEEWPQGYLGELAQFARDNRSTLITGVPLVAVDLTKPLGGDWYNSAIAINGATPAAASTDDHAAEGAFARYHKQHLVPFGEFIPFGFRWFVDAMNMPLGDFTRGDPAQAPFAVADQRVAVNICYEDMFGNEIAQALRRPDAATILLNLSNIGWFGNTIALPQHLLGSRMRALESGRPMLRSTNTGITAIIDQRGNVVSQLAPFTLGTLAGTVQGFSGTTPYLRFGDAPFVMLIGAGLLLAMIRRP